MPEVAKVLAKGETKSSVKLHNGLDADLRVVAKESFGAALQYFTGSKDHNIELRKIAEEQGYKLNEYGLFKLKSQNSTASPSEAGRAKVKTAIKNSKVEEKITAGKTEEEV